MRAEPSVFPNTLTCACRIPLPVTHVAVRNCPPNQHTEISVLVSGSRPHPWIARLPKAKSGSGEATGHVELEVTLPEPPSKAFGAPCTLRVWNCSGPKAPVHKGVKWLAVFRGAKVIWHGVLCQGSTSAGAVPPQSRSLSPKPSQLLRRPFLRLCRALPLCPTQPPEQQRRRQHAKLQLQNQQQPPLPI